MDNYGYEAGRRGGVNGRLGSKYTHCVKPISTETLTCSTGDSAQLCGDLNRKER